MVMFLLVALISFGCVDLVFVICTGMFWCLLLVRMVCVYG